MKNGKLIKILQAFDPSIDVDIEIKYTTSEYYKSVAEDEITGVSSYRDKDGKVNGLRITAVFDYL